MWAWIKISLPLLLNILYIKNKANLRNLIAASGLVFLLNIGFKSFFGGPCDLEIWWKTSKNNRAPPLYYVKLLCIISKPPVNSNLSYSPETSNFGQNWWFFFPCDLTIWRMTLKKNRAHILCYFKLCASFHSHPWIKNGGTVRKRQILVTIGIFCPVWPWNLTDDLEK